jgi:hypothetical protein
MSTNFHSWYIFGFLVVISVILNLVFSLMIASYLSKHGNKINYWWDMRFHIVKYLKQYRKLTIEENGKPGKPFYAWVAAISLFLVSVIFLIVLLVGGK